MPEILLPSIPPLEITPDNSSETDNGAGSSDRSAEVRCANRSVQSSNNNHSKTNSSSKTKPRKSNTKRLCQKPNNVQPKRNIKKINIPKPLLLSPSSTSSTFSTPAKTFRSKLPVSATKTLVTTREQSVSAVLQRQKTGIILAYRERKSISQMDMKHFRRHGQHGAQEIPLHAAIHEKSLMVSHNCVGQNYDIPDNQSFSQKMLAYSFNNNGFDNKERESRMAGMKIFATIMLNAWRKRRKEVKQLTEEISELKKGAIKARNQLHVVNTLFRVEQKRNDELNSQLKYSQENLNSTKSSCETLANSIEILKSEKSLLEQQNQAKDQELENFNYLFTQSKSDLLNMMVAQQDLQRKLSMEQAEVQKLQTQKMDLINEIFELKFTSEETQQQLNNQIAQKFTEIESYEEKIQELQENIIFLKYSHQQQLAEALAREMDLKIDIEKLEMRVQLLNECLEGTMGNRLNKLCYTTLNCTKFSLHMLHWLAYSLLPATPPPKLNTFPFGLTLAKVLNIVKR
ncbi:uncharacterized protein LOC142241215 [Haematobia irritans]|uniref:uncharacterized protein LOC142241215 n=1 Tax=Haematobia irritans TaxID=7368 RepID=UPI003F4F49C9